MGSRVKVLEDSTSQATVEVGTYLCPDKGAEVSLEVHGHMATLHWPVVVKPCPACGQEHVLQYEDVRHPPALGYE